MMLTEAALKLDRTDTEQGGWKGQAADAFRTALNTHRTRIGKLRASYERNAHTLNDWAGQLREFQRRARALEQRASQAQDDLRTIRVPQVHQPTPSYADQQGRYQSELRGVQGQARQLKSEYLLAAKLIAREIGRDLELPSGHRGWYGQTVDRQQENALPAAEAHRKGGAVPVDEEERLLWWQQLSPKQQQALIQNEASDIGNANGLPAQTRSDANMVQLRRALQDAHAQQDKGRIKALETIMYPMTDPHDPLHQPPMFLLGFDEKGNGHAIVCYGNPDIAANTAVYVPGTGTTLSGTGTGKCHRCMTMAAPRKYSLELRERVVRMYRTSDPKPQIKRLAADLGVHPEALRGWIRQAEADHGERDDRLTTDERAELTALRKENAQLKQANEVLRTASAFFAAQLDPTRPR